MRSRESPSRETDDLRTRFRENAVGIVTTAVTGITLAALFVAPDLALVAMVLGYVVVIPITAMLLGDETTVREWWGEFSSAGEAETGTDAVHGGTTPDGDRTALQTLRKRYATGELTDEQFERKLERLVETETVADVEAHVRRRDDAEIPDRGREFARER